MEQNNKEMKEKSINDLILKKLNIETADKQC